MGRKSLFGASEQRFPTFFLAPKWGLWCNSIGFTQQIAYFYIAKRQLLLCNSYRIAVQNDRFCISVAVRFLHT